MSYVKCIDKSKIWIALAVMALALFMWGYHADVMAETTAGEGSTTTDTTKTDTTKKKFDDPNLFVFSEVEAQTYTGSAIKPTITVTEIIDNETTEKEEGETAPTTPEAAPEAEETGETPSDSQKVQKVTLVEGKDYTLTYANNTNAGTATITVKPVNTEKYTGEKTINFTIKPVDINTLELTTIDRIYKGVPLKPDVNLYFNGKKLARSIDYHVGSYKNNTDVGTATCVVKGDGNFTGKRTEEFKISPKNIYSLSYSEVTTKTYTGTAITPAVTIIDTSLSPDKTLTRNTDYTLSYIDNVRVGMAGIIINGTGNYTGSKIMTFKIRPKSTTLVRLTKGKKKIKVKWKKRTAQLTGYEIQYSTNSKFSGAKKVTVKKTIGTKTLTKLKGKKKYYVRVRVYKSVAGIKYYSAWSNVKSVTTKK